MVPSFPNGETVTVLRAGVVTDPYSGEPSGLDWDSPTSAEYPGCAVGLNTTDESLLVGRDMTQVALSVYMPHGGDVTSADRMTVRGVTYQVFGDPFQWVSPFSGTDAGLEVMLQVVEG